MHCCQLYFCLKFDINIISYGNKHSDLLSVCLLNAKAVIIFIRRPIAGHANLCPNSISTKPQDLDTLLSTVKHEILHALVSLAFYLYAFMR